MSERRMKQARKWLADASQRIYVVDPPDVKGSVRACVQAIDLILTILDEKKPKDYTLK